MKIVVLGVSASGKTTFTRELEKKTSITATHIDATMWKPGWEYIGDEKTVAAIETASQGDSWIIEGYIVKDARVDLFNKADRILYLDYPNYLSAWRYLLRCLKHRKNARLELPGSPDKFKFKTLKLIYNKGEVWKLEKLFKEYDWNKKITRFRSPKEAEQYLQSL